MAVIADLHIHSRFSRACSPQLNVKTLSQWAGYKGINLLGTGDFLHPLWLSELKANLVEDGSGFLTFNGSEVRFVLSVEIASIYTHRGKGRRIHNVVMLPNFLAADNFQHALLAKKATLASDGRPIVGIPSKELLAIALQADEKAIFIPAHIWTPWFGVFGSESGYDSLKDCFEDLTPYIYAIETGLSSDPAMNWRVSELDDLSITSSSDAHSLPNLGRELTIFQSNLNQGYQGLWQDIKKQNLVGTIEFYPEEGKYHYTGHRSCNVKYSPQDTKRNGVICPVCGKGLTVGVMERVEKLSTRGDDELRIINYEGKITTEVFNRPGYKMLVPLHQIIAEAVSSAPTSQKVLNEYKKLVETLGGEVKVLTKTAVEEIAKISSPKVAEGVEKVRRGDLVIDPGYDGVYGVVKIWREGEQKEEKPQLGLFD